MAAWRMAIRRPKEYCSKVDAAQRLLTKDDTNKKNLKFAKLGGNPHYALLGHQSSPLFTLAFYFLTHLPFPLDFYE